MTAGSPSRWRLVLTMGWIALCCRTSTALSLQGRHLFSNSKRSTGPPPLLPLHHGDGVIPQAPTSSSIGRGSTRTSLPSTVANPMQEQQIGGWRGKLLRVSNIASLLCVLDCTILPLVTVVLPFFGLVAATPAQMEYLHQLGHRVALGFVLPVGGSATFLNYLYAHRQKRIAALGILGLLMVFAANAPHNLLHILKHQKLLSFLYPIMHAVHHGIAHRMTNILGCVCLLTSNYLSKQTGKCFLACCDPSKSLPPSVAQMDDRTNFVTHAYVNRDINNNIMGGDPSQGMIFQRTNPAAATDAGDQ